MSTTDTRGAATAPSETTLVVDGSNIATEGRTVPSLAQLDDAVRALLAERTFGHVVVVVDATFGHRIDRSESNHFEEAILAGELVTPPAGTIGRGDAFILQIADRANAIVFSNDSFQEFHGTYDWLFDEGRLLGGKPVGGIGWVFVHRNPVRGPTSRKAVRDAKRGSTPSTRGRRAPAAPLPDLGPPPVPTPDNPPPAPPRRRGRGRGSAAATEAPAAAPSPAESAANSEGGGSRSRRSKRTRKSGPPINEPLPFLQFVTEHPVGGTVEGDVVEFSSHGAYVEVGSARCYVALTSMGDPAPKSAREVLSIGERRRFVVEGFDTPRRGIDLSLVDTGASNVVDDPRGTAGQLIENRSTDEPAEEAMLATTKKAPAKKAPAKKAAAAKAPAKKAPAKAPAKKAPAKKAVAAKAPAKKAPAKAPAKKAPAKKAVAAKAPAKKAPAKAPAKKAPAKKAPAKKAVAAKAPAKKAPAKKAPAKAPAKKAPAKKAPAKR